ncbi:hypothetical protein M408DRAFT_235655 [Serendipita vermifera MAFF 305830]|uniref:Mnd1 HTH domain-containing protein n=1 Tax=Serendipita vermifera MAFF 305830 TaxID=933852 RepID=A0A0C3BHP8_SERVB|nr:hypothetical protein M408DRAFT_235655 [Serendipita vermifera MAFF 305830]
MLLNSEECQVLKAFLKENTFMQNKDIKDLPGVAGMQSVKLKRALASLVTKGLLQTHNFGNGTCYWSPVTLILDEETTCKGESEEICQRQSEIGLCDDKTNLEAEIEELRVVQQQYVASDKSQIRRETDIQWSQNLSHASEYADALYGLGEDDENAEYESICDGM